MLMCNKNQKTDLPPSNLLMRIEPHKKTILPPNLNFIGCFSRGRKHYFFVLMYNKILILT